EITVRQLNPENNNNTMSPIYRKLKLYAIEITPEKMTSINYSRDYPCVRIKSYRDIHLYYG
ncbi:hypothetical protein N8751_01435, partial [bacterium]|nr:hypothetical protein [bacterium]